MFKENLEQSLHNKCNKKKIFRIAYIGCAIIMLLCAFAFSFSNILNNTNGGDSLTTETVSGTADDVMYSLSDAKSYLTSKYHDKNHNHSLKIEQYDSKFVKSINLAQWELNYDYNRIYRELNGNTNYGGTCTEVAATILTIMYANLSDSQINVTFNDILNYAKEKGYFHAPHGTGCGDADYIINYALDLYEKSKIKCAEDNYFSVYESIKSQAKNDCLTMFNISGHSMVGAGYYEYKVTWKEKKKVLLWTKEVEKSEIEKFVVVNAGWYTKRSEKQNSSEIGVNNVYQLYPADKIGYNFFEALFLTSPYYDVVIKTAKTDICPHWG